MNMSTDLKINGRPSSKERFITALRGGIPDYVPMFDFLNSQPLYEAFLGHCPANYNTKDAITLSLQLGFDAAFIPFGGFKGYNAEFNSGDESATSIDEWGTTYKASGVSWPASSPVDYPIKTPQDLRDFNAPDPTLPQRLDGVKEALALSQDRVAILGGVNGPLTVAFTLVGWETLLIALHEDPDFVHALFKIGANYYNEACQLMIDAGVDGILIAEDMGFGSGLLMSPTHFRHFLFPLLEDIIKQIQDRDVPVLLHCDGNINSIIDDLVDLGINGYNPVERKAHMDIIALKQKYRDRLCLVGNVDSTDTLCRGTPEQVRTEVLDLLKNVAPGGSFIMCSDSDIRNEMPIQNILAMIETTEQFGRYPISLSNH